MKWFPKNKWFNSSEKPSDRDSACALYKDRCNIHKVTYYILLISTKNVSILRILLILDFCIAINPINKLVYSRHWALDHRCSTQSEV
jgi:hypothetical protein